MSNHQNKFSKPSREDDLVFQRMRERHFQKVLDNPPQCSLVELRKSCHLTQTGVAATLGVRQLAVSRLERRRNIQLDSLHTYAAALGGELHMIVRFPRRAVRLVWTETG